MSSGDSAAVAAALDELYGVDPSEFVATRERLAAGLRAAGDTAGATALRSAKRPTRSAWALNQLARTERSVLDDLLDRSEELATAQDAALAGDRDRLRTATAAQRAALQRAVDATLGLLAAPVSEGMRNEILTTLQSAAVDADVAQVLRAGRLTTAVTTTAGFGDNRSGAQPSRRGDGAAPPKASGGGGRAHLRAVADPRDEHRQQAQAAAALRKAEDDLARATRRLTAAEREEHAAAARVDDLQAELANARDTRVRAARKLRDERAGAAALEREVERRRKQVSREQR